MSWRPSGFGGRITGVMHFVHRYPRPCKVGFAGTCLRITKQSLGRVSRQLASTKRYIVQKTGNTTGAAPSFAHRKG